MMLGRKRERFIEDTDDILVIFDHEQKTADIKRITSITDDAVIVNGVHNVPYHDCEIATGEDGRIFFYKAPTQSISETKRLAALEKNMIIDKVANYRYADEGKTDLTKIWIIGALMLSILMLGLSSCGGV